MIPPMDGSVRNTSAGVEVSLTATCCGGARRGRVPWRVRGPDRPGRSRTREVASVLIIASKSQPLARRTVHSKRSPSPSPSSLGLLWAGHIILAFACAWPNVGSWGAIRIGTSTATSQPLRWPARRLPFAGVWRRNSSASTATTVCASTEPLAGEVSLTATLRRFCTSA